MKEEKIKELLNSLFALEYSWSSERSNYKSKVINEEGKSNVETIIRSYILENRDDNSGVLEAKVKFYEEMISKSNFAPFLQKEESKYIIEPEQSEMQIDKMFSQTQIEMLQHEIYLLAGEGKIMELFNDFLGIKVGS